MPFDGIVTRAATNELETAMLGGRINKVYQPTSNEIIITFRNNGKNTNLLISIHPMYARFHTTTEKFTNPQEPPLFCMVLRKHLIGTRITSIEQISLERIVRISVDGRNEIGDAVKKNLTIELMGKHSNIILINEENEAIIDAIKHIGPLQNRHRTILPGQPYIMPPAQDKLDPLSIPADSFSKSLNFNQGKMDSQIVQTLTGFSPFAATEITTRAHLGNEDAYNQVFKEIQNSLIKQVWTPAIYEGRRQDFHVLDITHTGEPIESFESVFSMLETFFTGKAERDRVSQQAKDLTRFIKNELDKNKRKMKKLEQSLKKSERANKFQKDGELLTAHMHEVKSGDKEIIVTDYYDPDQGAYKIQLDPLKSPSENAQSFFKTYQKLKNSRLYIRSEMAKTKRENDYFETLVQQIETAREQDILDIREELIDGGYLRDRQKKGQKKRKSKPTPEKFTASDGTIIYVGRNNKQNDYLTTKLAHRNDVWLHTKDTPGSHVVIKSEEPSPDTLFEAAQLSALFSKAKDSSSVPVDYTTVKHVKKPSGAKPGFVTYDNHQTILVTPEQTYLKKLKTTD